MSSPAPRPRPPEPPKPPRASVMGGGASKTAEGGGALRMPLKRSVAARVASAQSGNRFLQIVALPVEPHCADLKRQRHISLITSSLTLNCATSSSCSSEKDASSSPGFCSER